MFSTGDLGVQRGMAALAGKDVAKLKNGKGKWKYMSEKDMVETSDRFAPYRYVLFRDRGKNLADLRSRSVYMWYTWRVEETDISTFEQ